MQPMNMSASSSSLKRSSQTDSETHGHHDHIGAVTEMREAGYEVAVTAADAPMLKEVGYDVLIDDKEVIEFGSLRLHAIITRAIARIDLVSPR